MANRSRDWFAQAERDLEHARHARRDGSHEWACFACQQAAEKAAKALHANGHPDGAPFEHYGPLQSEMAIAHASAIVAFVRARLAEPAAG